MKSHTFCARAPSSLPPRPLNFSASALIINHEYHVTHNEMIRYAVSAHPLCAQIASTSTTLK